MNPHLLRLSQAITRFAIEVVNNVTNIKESLKFSCLWVNIYL